MINRIGWRLGVINECIEKDYLKQRQKNVTTSVLKQSNMKQMDTVTAQNPNGEISMEQNSQAKMEPLEAQIRECFGRVAWSHKTQEKCADILLKRDKTIKIWQIGLSAVTTTSIIGSFLGESQIGVIIGGILSAVLLGLNAYTKGYNLGEISQKHSDAAIQLWNIRELYLSVLTDIKSNTTTIEDIQNRRDQLQEKLATIYQGSPRTISKAYVEATKALKVNEELTFSDEEIDKLLPVALRKQ